MTNGRTTSPRVCRIACLMTCLIAGVFSASVARSAPADAPVPLADFFRNPLVSSAVMSPDGHHIAVAMTGGPQARRRLMVLDVDDLAKSKLVAGFANADVQGISWVNDERLVFTLTDAQSAWAGQVGQGLYAVDREGRAPPRSLIKRRNDFIDAPASRRELDGRHQLFAVLRDGSNDVVVQSLELDARYRLATTKLLRLDTLTAGTRLLTPNAPEHTVGWALDAAGVPRVAVTRWGGQTRVLWKPAPDAAWTLFREFATAAEAVSFAPLAVDRADRLYAAAPETPSADTTVLLRFDMRTPDAAPKALLDLEGHDFTGALVRGAGGDPLGVHYIAEERGTHWFDGAMKAVQAQVDRLLPDTNNIIGCGNCQKPRIVLVTASSDQQPNVYLLFDVAAGTLKPLFGARPWIQAAAMAQREFRYVSARDGLRIPVHVTRPPRASGPAPMVVLVHGGPWARGAGWAWDAETQFLAARGYVVIEPEFRSSTGYGARLFRAGWKQWGLAMQDDIADATRWAIAEGLADPARVCIAGASYGGYAVLMGLIRDASLYRCGFEWVGVSDIDLLFATNGAYDDEVARDFGLLDLVGDPAKDGARFAATSPLQRAAELHQPLLMAYGGLDDRVTIAHGTKMRRAVQAHNPQVEWIEYADEGHGWSLEANRVDFWTKVERFLDRNLKSGP